MINSAHTVLLVLLFAVLNYSISHVKLMLVHLFIVHLLFISCKDRECTIGILFVWSFKRAVGRKSEDIYGRDADSGFCASGCRG